MYADLISEKSELETALVESKIESASVAIYLRLMEVNTQLRDLMIKKPVVKKFRWTK